MGLFDAILAGLAILVAAGFAVSLWGAVLMWRARRLRRRIDRLLAAATAPLAARGDADRPAAALPALPASDAGLGHATAASSSFADDVASRLMAAHGCTKHVLHGK